MHIRAGVVSLEITQSYIPAIFNGYVSHLTVDNKIESPPSKTRSDTPPK